MSVKVTLTLVMRMLTVLILWEASVALVRVLTLVMDSILVQVRLVILDYIIYSNDYIHAVLKIITTNMQCHIGSASIRTEK